MSLYDDLDIDHERKGGKDVVAGWSSNYKLMKSQLQAKKAQVTPSSKSRSRNNNMAPVVDLKRTADNTEGPLKFNMQTGRSRSRNNNMAPVVDLKRTADNTEGPLKFNMQTGRLERDLSREPQQPVAVGSSPFIPSDPVPSLTGVKDEYNPLRPNDYEEITKKKKEQRQKEDDERKRDRGDDFDRNRGDRGDRRRRDREKDRDVGEMERARRRREDDEEEYERPVRRKQDSGAAIAPPPSILEEPPVKRDDNDEYGGGFGGGSVASKIMAKYGYKEGQGLGKSEQGMSTALFVEKTSKRGGKIIHERDLPKDGADPDEMLNFAAFHLALHCLPKNSFKKQVIKGLSMKCSKYTPREPIQTNANLMRNPTKVILLRNMVGPGEVDEDLEPETFEECGKYGKVIKCLIFEMPGVTEDEAVRIFIEFDRIDSAIKAIIDLNGRYFGGRVVKACFYNLDKFRRLDLGSEVD